ncbi:Poly glycohydrolase, partial [Globisporangium splendens]
MHVALQLVCSKTLFQQLHRTVSHTSVSPSMGSTCEEGFVSRTVPTAKRRTPVPAVAPFRILPPSSHLKQRRSPVLSSRLHKREREKMAMDTRVSSPRAAAAGGGTGSTLSKRKWAEVDWDVVMEAQSFVAVYADPEPDDDEEEEAEQKKQKATKRTTTKGKKKKKAGKPKKIAVADETASTPTAKAGKSTRPTASESKPTRRGTRTQEKAAQEEKKEENEPNALAKEASGADSAEQPVDEFWIAQLQDDVTQDMLDADDATVRITWLNKVSGQTTKKKDRYVYAYNDTISVQTILCHVYLVEFDDESLEITPKSLARIQKSIVRTKFGNSNDDEDDGDDDNEKPPPSRIKVRPSGGRKTEGGSSGRARSGGSSTTSKKLSKRELELHIPPKYATVDADAYEDRELFGKQGFTSWKQDTFSANREVLRAVMTKNHKLLKKLTSDKSVYKEISSFTLPRSADISKTPLQYAIDFDDVTAAGMLIKAREIEQSRLAKRPEVSLPSHSTGKHTSAFSDYNRRAINASRGGREGNKALVEDTSVYSLSGNQELHHIWKSTAASPKMLTVLYPKGDFYANGYETTFNIAHAARMGNYKFVAKVVEILSKNGGYGFNDLHYKVLSDTDEDLPAFRSVSAVKMAIQTRVRPLHLAAINPNTKYLEALWESAGNEWSGANDTNGYEPIHYAAACEGIGPLKFLLERNVSLFVRSKSRETPMIRALLTKREDNAILMLEMAAEQSEDNVKQLVSERGPQSRQPIHYAAQNGCPRVIEKLLDYEADVNSAAADKITPLCYAAQNGHFECVKILLEKGAKVDLGDKLKKTPLMYAVKNGHTRIAALLINHGANVNAFDTSENSVVHYAASYGWTSCLQLLVDSDAEFWSRNSWGFVPLICALLQQRLTASEFILEHDVNKRFLDYRDRQGCTMLFLQCKHSKNVAQIQYLLEKGLNPNVCDSENEYPLQTLILRASTARENGVHNPEEITPFYEEAIRLLLHHGAFPQYEIEKPKNQANDEEPTEFVQWQPLQLAMKGSLNTVFDLLLNEFNANPDAIASNGMDAWMVAASMGKRGDNFLDALLKHHSKIHKGKKLEFSAREGSSHNKANFFHVVARNEVKELISPDLIRQCISKCANPSALMNEKDDIGRSPLLLLLGKERKVRSKITLTISEKSDQLEEDTRLDIAYSELVSLLAENTTSADAFVRYVDQKGLSAVGTTTIVTTIDEESEAASDADDEEASENGSDSDSESGSGSESEPAASENEAALSARKQATSANGSPSETKLVKYETALHMAANRKLTCGASEVTEKWLGKNLVGILFEASKKFLGKDVVNFPDYMNNKTALHYAVEANDLETTQLLLSNDADPDHSPFRCEICIGKLQGATDQTCTSNCGKELVETALFSAVKRGCIEVTKLLLAHGANVACFERRTLNTPLHLALGANNASIVKELLGRGANLSKRNASGAAPLHLAILAKHSIPESELHQGEIEYTDLTSSTSSKVAAGTSSAIAAALKDKKATHAVVLEDSKSLTPIHLAAANRDLALLSDLVNACSDKKAATNCRDAYGRTPLHHAVNMASMSPDASFEVERFLLQCGTDANAVDKFGFSPLHFALFKVDMDWHKKYDDDRNENNAKKAQEDRDAGTYDDKKHKAFLDSLAKIPKSETDPVETVSNLASVRGINVLLQDVLGRSPLHLAAATGAFVCVSMLLSACSTESNKVKALSQLDKDEFTPIGQAVLHLRQTSIMTLLQSNADVRGKIGIKTPVSSTSSGEDKKAKIKYVSYFYHAVKHSLTGICHMLLTAKFCHRQAIEDAVSCGQFQLARNLMIATEVTNDLRLLTRLNDSGEDLLHTLAKVDKPFDKLARTIAWTLVDAGVNPSHRDKKGNTALHYAAKNGNIHLLDFLLHNKCRLNQPNEVGETALLYATKRSKKLSGAREEVECFKVLKYFLGKTGIDIHAKDKAGSNILTAVLDRFVDKMASDRSFFVWIDKLLKEGVDPNGMFTSLARNDFFKNKALAESSVSLKITALVRLVYTPSPYVRYHGIALLLRYGAKITGCDGNGNSFLMHLVAKNLMNEVKLALGKIKLVHDPAEDPTKKALKTLHIAANDVKTALAQTNHSGLTALHFAVKPFEFESFENVSLVRLLLDAGANIHAKDAEGRSALDYTRDQSSRFVFRFLKKEYPKLVTQSEQSFFNAGNVEDEHMFDSTPDYSEDAREYLLECEQNGKIQRKRIDPNVNSNCDVGKVSRVYSKIDDAGELVKGEEYDALLTKVDVKNGRFGLNVFYRLQLVQDEIQGIFIVFTNWGRIGETGKYQNTPFHSSDDAVAEFKKIFRSKTGNQWDERHSFVKHSKKYNLVQRVNTHTKLDKEVTASFTEVSKEITFPAFTDPGCFSPSVVTLLGAITDIRNLQLAATENCNYSDSLPLARQDELVTALNQLREIRAVIEEREEVNKSITEVGGNITEEAAASLSDLSSKYTELTEVISEKSSRYYEVMPCNEDAFGSSIQAFDSIVAVNKEITRLRLLVDIMETYKMLLGAKRLQREVHPLEYCYNAMQVHLTPMVQDSKETALLTKYFFNGIRKYEQSKYRVSNMFRVDRQGEKARFLDFLDENPKFKSKHSHLLWHGTRRTNLMGILSQGLRIAPPEAPHHGYAYGKGLYFADVTTKSLDYCGSPYLIKGTSVDRDGKSVETVRTIYYMLLCEVTTGDATELVAPTFAETIPEGIESVKALSKYVPDPSGWVVSPESGAMLHLGSVGQVGVTFPVDSVWAKTRCNPEPLGWYERTPTFTNETQQYLSTIVESLKVGETFTVEDTKKMKLFMQYYYGAQKKITVELLSKQSGDDTGPASESSYRLPDVGMSCDATVKVTFSDEHQTYSYSAKRYRNMLYSLPVDDGYTLERTERTEYSEYIVYNEAQARIRYLLEVEQI